MGSGKIQSVYHNKVIMKSKHGHHIGEREFAEAKPEWGFWLRFDLSEAIFFRSGFLLVICVEKKLADPLLQISSSYIKQWNTGGKGRSDGKKA